MVTFSFQNAELLGTIPAMQPFDDFFLGRAANRLLDAV
jgi:hypothetical protein